jgi:hypothetical protein
MLSLAIKNTICISCFEKHISVLQCLHNHYCMLCIVYSCGPQSQFGCFWKRGSYFVPAMKWTELVAYMWHWCVVTCSFCMSSIFHLNVKCVIPNVYCVCDWSGQNIELNCMLIILYNNGCQDGVENCVVRNPHDMKIWKTTCFTYCTHLFTCCLRYCKHTHTDHKVIFSSSEII